MQEQQTWIMDTQCKQKARSDQLVTWNLAQIDSIIYVCLCEWNLLDKGSLSGWAFHISYQLALATFKWQQIFIEPDWINPISLFTEVPEKLSLHATKIVFVNNLWKRQWIQCSWYLSCRYKIPINPCMCFLKAVLPTQTLAEAYFLLGPLHHLERALSLSKLVTELKFPHRQNEENAADLKGQNVGRTRMEKQHQRLERGGNRKQMKRLGFCFVL